MKNHLRVLWRALRYIRPYLRLQLLALLLAVGATASEFIWPYVSKLMIDRVFYPNGLAPQVRVDTAWMVARLAIGMGLLGMLLRLGRAYLFARVGEHTAADLRRDLMGHLHRLPIGFFDVRKTGGVMSVLSNDVEALQGLYSSTLVEIATSLLTVVVVVAFLFIRNPLLAALGMPVPILFGLVLAGFGPSLTRSGRAVREETGHVQEVLQETIAGAREVKSFGRGGAELSRVMGRVDRLIGVRIRMAVLGSSNGAVAGTVALVGDMIIIAIGAGIVVRGGMTAGDLILFTSVLSMLFGPAGTFVNIGGQVLMALGAAQRIFEFLDTPLEVDRPGAAAPRLEGRVSIEDVSFRYRDEDPMVLEAIDLEAAPGEVVALVGPSGSGKTTLVSLLTRMYEPTAGAVLIDGRPITDLPLDCLRSQVAVVPQEPFLFAASVRENIRFGRLDATEEAVEEASRAANAHEFITSLPSGYDTEVGERGTRLSVGQKQRIAIARALLRDPRILILDEATSAQDAESERLVQEAVGRLLKGRTSFVIAHRLATVLSADRIVVLQAGRVVETGSHDELLAGGGLYARLHSLQFAGAEADGAGD